MRIRQLFTDDDAVSPVIGVILMVAITVILAAVIGAFVLGFGGGGPSAPTASWDTNEEVDTPSSSEITITFTAESVSDSFDASTLSVDGTQASEATVEAGSTIEVVLQTSGSDTYSPGDEIDLVWSEDGSSSTIATHTLEGESGETYSVSSVT
ncbi:hypothetical protein GCM10028857_06470 [Salinarchaeum chitinilyticum]